MRCTIAVDMMGGDHGLKVTLPAVLTVLDRCTEVTLILVGDEALLKNALRALSEVQRPRCRIQPAGQSVDMEESPLSALRNKPNSSMRIAVDLVQQCQADACVSAGNTAALVAISRFVLKTLPGISRPAISTVLPTLNPNQTVRLMDVGANVDVSAEHLVQFAIMGTVLAAEIDRIAKPKLAILSIGAESGKGNAQVKKLDELLTKQASKLNYIGQIEGDTLYQGVADVVICDGFVGNVVLKITEGVAKLVTHSLQRAFHRHLFSKLVGWIARPLLRQARQQLDPRQYNGASLVGLQGIVIKSHGSADQAAFTSALLKAVLEVKRAVPKRIQDQVSILLNP